MDYSGQLDALQKHLAEAKSAVETAATESRDQIRARIDQVQAEMHSAVKDAQQKASLDHSWGLQGGLPGLTC